MNGPGNRRARANGRLAAVLAVTLSALLGILLLAQLITGAVRLLGTGGPGERDPQFAEQAQPVTRPPELAGEAGGLGGDEDPSARWELGEQTPVDKTAEELSREAEAGQR